MAGQCRIDERGRRIKIAMDTYEVNLRHVLDMETSNLRLSCIETHHSDARGTYSYDSQPSNLRMRTHRNKQEGKRPSRDIRARIHKYEVS